MLDGVDDVFWENLQFTYGKGGNLLPHDPDYVSSIPSLLRALAAGDPAALSDISTHIYHQCTIWEGTSYVVPFLIEILDAGVSSLEILCLLQQLAEGESFHDVHYEGVNREPQEIQVAISRELGWVRATQAAVRKGRPVYLRFFRHDDAETRGEAGLLLSYCHDAVELLAGELASCLETEPEDYLRASILLVMHRLRIIDQEQLSRWLHDDAKIIRVVAALVAVQLQGQVPAELFAILRDCVPVIQQSWEKLPQESPRRNAFSFTFHMLPERWEAHLPLIESWLHHPDKEVREEALYGIKTMLQRGHDLPASLIREIIDCLRDAASEVVDIAANLLLDAAGKEEQALDALWALLQRDPAGNTLRISAGVYSGALSAAIALCQVHDARVAPYLSAVFSRVASSLEEQGRSFSKTPDFKDLKYALIKILSYLGPWAQPCYPPLRRLASLLIKDNSFTMEATEALERYRTRSNP